MSESSAPGELAPFPFPAAGKKLQDAADTRGQVKIADLLAQDPQRVADFSCAAAGWRLDYSRQLLTRASRDGLLELAQEADLASARNGLFDGSLLNHTENRPALHTLLRAKSAGSALAAELQAVKNCRRAMADWIGSVRSGAHKGFAGKPITDIVNLGIGGSDLGPRMTTAALLPYQQPGLQVHFCANIDPDELRTCLLALNPATTLFIVCSKTFSTEETLFNARQARDWLLQAGATQDQLARHFLAVSSNLVAAKEFGIPEENVLPIWDWVGGRYSLWSAIGWSIAFSVGMENFEQLLAGAEEMDQHFRTAPIAQNLPAWLSLLEIWTVNFLGAQSHAVIPYHHALSGLPAYLQQLSMESNGKRVNHQGMSLNYATAPVLWGGVGSNVQHSFHQLLHQGTLLCPVDFILFTDTGGMEGKQRLLSNGLSQAQALMVGRSEADAYAELLDRGVPEERARSLAPHLVIPGNRPSSTLSCPQLTPHSLGALLALYEHKTFCSGHLWQINSFDQWGVELGKELGAKIFEAMSNSAESTDIDPSTSAILETMHHE